MSTGLRGWVLGRATKETTREGVELYRTPLRTGVFFVLLNLLIAVTSVLSFIAGEQSSVSIDSTLLNIVTGCVAAFGVASGCS